jgi:DNA-binding protein H-NS
MKLEEVQSQIAKLQKQAAELINNEKSQTISRIRQLMESYQITLAELKPSKKTIKGVRAKAKIKFKDPATGKQWSGRGRRPAWVKESMRV